MPTASNHTPVRLAEGRDRPLSWSPAVYRRATIVASRSVTVKLHKSETDMLQFKVIFFLNFTHNCFAPGLCPVPRPARELTAPPTPPAGLPPPSVTSTFPHLTLISDHNLLLGSSASGSAESRLKLINRLIRY